MKIVVPTLAAAALIGFASPPNNSDARVVRIIATDYAFQAPAELAAGRVTFVLENRGKTRHELSMVLLNPGVTMNQVVAAINARQGGQQRLRTAVGILLAAAGNSSEGAMSTTLLPGRDYGIVCTFNDGAGAPAHVAMGMYGVIHVVSAGATSTLEAKADTIVGTDYAYRSPSALTPGLHRFAFRNSGSVKHEADIILLRKGVNPETALAAQRKGVHIDSVFEAGIGALIAQPGTSPLGTLQTTLLAGRDYLITCGVQDKPGSPRHFMLGMEAVIHVATRTR
jgi:hypothetical protein